MSEASQRRKPGPPKTTPVKILLPLPSAMLAGIDAVRGDETRTSFIRRAIGVLLDERRK